MKRLSLFLIFLLLLSGCSSRQETVTGQVLDFWQGKVIVSSLSSTQEGAPRGRISADLQDLQPSPEPQVGDVVEIIYEGGILPGTPPSIGKVVSIRILTDQPEASAPPPIGGNLPSLVP